MATQPMFKFKLGWLLRDVFIEMVKDIWVNTIGAERLWRDGSAKYIC
jgi:hypothetical protein